jgi:uncharacterized protein YfaS (alpha-2-macroglobulin family)
MTTPRIFWLSSAAVLLAGTSGPENPAPVSATYVRGVLRAAIPYHASRAGAGLLTLEVVNPEDEILARSERRTSVPAGAGVWRDDLRLTRPLATGELAWHRLRYQFAYDAAGTAPVHGVEAISDILRMPELRIVGQQTWLSGAPAAVRVVVSDSRNDPIPGAGSVRIALNMPDGKQLPLYSGALNARGTAEAQFRVPAGLTGTFPVRYTAETPLGSAEYTQQVRLEDQVSTLLTTEKPIYQPGQTIHVRALTLNRASHEAIAARKLTFELEDARGNRIFRQAAQTSKFGVASAAFSLADEVNPGTWHLRAMVEDTNNKDGHHAAELALSVQRYVLPKFKVAVEFANNDQRAKRCYRPGDHVAGTVRANYFFGKPVDSAEITVAASAIDTGVSEVASVRGKTDGDGAYRFDLRLPDYFIGRPLDRGVARVLIEARVKDNAAHTESRGEPITVSESPLILTAVPEGGTLIPHLDNRIFVLASYPDGSPARADVTVEPAGNPVRRVSTDAGGVAIVTLLAHESPALAITAADKDGNHASASVKLEARAGEDQILLRTERAIYKAGDRIALRVFSTRKRGAAYVDVIRDGQTILTRDVDLADGAAELGFAVTAAMAGTLDCNVYLFGSNGRPVADHRLVFVQPADELKIETTADAAEYKPGGEARVRFKVTNSRGEGVEAALGVQAVDEAVFALAEKQPGFAKVFFYLEQEAMKPRYEIHSIGMPDIVEPVEAARAGERDRAAQALFSATEMNHANRFEAEAGRNVLNTSLPDYHRRYDARFRKQVRALAAALNRAYMQKPDDGDLTKTAARLTQSGAPEIRDAWGHDFAVERAGGMNLFRVRATGPGGMGNFAAYLEVHPRKIATSAMYPGLSDIQANVEHDRGAWNGMAEVTGKVIDPADTPIAGATIELRVPDGARPRLARSDGEGRFTLSGVPPGDYEIRIESPGFNSASRKLKMAARDRAVLSAWLAVGSVSQTVEVADRAHSVGAAASGGGFAGGVFRVPAGQQGAVMTGVIGGVPGGIPGGVPGGIATGAPDMVEFNRLDRLAKINSAAVMPKAIAPAPAPHTRTWFPEALYINPEIITDRNGAAAITIPIADSITTWRMAMLASTTRGALGSGSANIKVFQDFFTDLDLPVTLTQGDRVSLPVAIYNYTGAGGKVKLQLSKDDWYALVEDSPKKTVAVESGRVGAAQFTIEARRIGKFRLTLAARMAGPGNHADIVVREIEVIPNGREKNIVFNGRLETSAEHRIDFPAGAIPGASKLFVRLYPGPLSQVIEGMDAILRLPGGCFEQTSSSTYPNVLALDYMKRTKKLTPEVHAKAEGFIANGYQRLLTFEVPGGGFSWFGQAPANKILTAYGLMEFFDMSQVHDVEPRVIRRTQEWLAGQQQADGSWKPDRGGINEGATNRYQSDLLRITAYIAWALENSGYKGTAVEKARQYVEGHEAEAKDAYTKAVVANFAADYRKDRNFTARAAQALLDARTGKDDRVWWTAEETGVFGRGDSAAVETTGLALQALLKWGEASGEVRTALAYITAKKDASGAWGTTQATIMALRALLLASSKDGADVSGTVEVTLNGAPVEHLVLTADNNDLLHQFTLDAKASSAIGIRFTGKGGLGYQVSGRYFVPWDAKPADEPLSIDVSYDRAQLVQDDIATATATVRNNLGQTARMVMVDLGIPPGFDLLSEDLQQYQANSAAGETQAHHGGRLEKFSLTATQAILYFDSIGARDTIRLRFRLRAKYPIRARTFQSRVYEYYQPEVNSVARPIALEIRAK